MSEIWGGIGWWRQLLVSMSVVVLIGCGLYPGVVRGGFYHVLRTGAQRLAEVQTRHYLVLEGEYFRVKFREDAEIAAASLVLETAESIYTPVNQILQYQPTHKVLIIMYPTEADLARCFGWPADQSALGVYWAGTVRVLSPHAWAVTETGKLDVHQFQRRGPMAHEYTHYVIDQMTAGNYPRWFTEGMAQWVEAELTDFTLENPFREEKTKENFAARLYPLAQMDHQFDRLPDQLLAYWESWMAIKFIQAEFGTEYVSALVTELSQGHNLEYVLQQVLAMDLGQFDGKFREWAATQVEK